MLWFQIYKKFSSGLLTDVPHRFGAMTFASAWAWSWICGWESSTSVIDGCSHGHVACIAHVAHGGMDEGVMV